MICYRDFVPETKDGKWFEGESYETLDAAVAAANAWIATESVNVVAVETVVLPNVEAKDEDGTTDAQLTVAGGWASWHQFVRVWYRQS